MSSISNLAGNAGDLAAYLQHHKHDAADKLFAKIDTDGDGKISKSELEAAFKAAGATADQADAMFSKMDTDGDGQVNKDEFVAAARGGHHAHHAQTAQGAADGGAKASLDPKSSSETQNPDGSTTTTIITADGTTITITTPTPKDETTPTASGAPKISFVA